MQALSSRAHAFSVESLVGKTVKKMKVDNGKDGSLTGEQDTSPVLHEKVEHEDSAIRVELQGSDLWTRFHEIGTEMIITKAGRRMFPSVRVKVRNLDPCQQYYLGMDIMPVDSKRYRYVYHSSQWMVAGNTDHSCRTTRLYVHPDSPCSGDTWMRQVINFDRVKLTNNEMDDKGHITKLKIDRNPFAKGFRDPSRNRGVLEGLLESYPWRSPLNLEFKPFTLQLQAGNTVSPGVCTSLKNVMPLSCLPSSQPFTLSSISRPDAGLHSFNFPFCCKTSSPLAARIYSSTQGFFPSPPLLSALQGMKASRCRAPWLHEDIPRHPTSLQPPPLHNHHLSPLDPAPAYCLYSYGAPINPQLASKLAQGTTDCLLHQAPWNTTINRCL
ncbi:hypothetical protein DPEC_G00029800 [Dallia pectoralis]|uniref:Uncharacterized protein n=1 Tax=Dallia pectoralis TaxID=75939 RepID=A0ACC2HJI1_DALPE|nr:hypothetical protein DPEC_G00029800 [Dallia pectoralis]